MAKWYWRVLAGSALGCALGLWSFCDVAQSEPLVPPIAAVDDAGLRNDGKAIVIKGQAGFVFKDGLGSAGAEVVRRVREEVISDALAQRLSGRSVMLTMDFDCVRKLTSVRDVQVYSANRLGGVETPMVPIRWLAANADLDLSVLVDGACTSQSPPQSVVPPPERSVVPPPERIDEAESPSSPPRPGPGGVSRWVQIGAYANQDVALQAGRALSLRTALNLSAQSARIEPARVGDRRLYRTLIGPFATLDQARAYCLRIKTTGSDCLVR